eukprot:6188771-Pleurochrysis_carterae.AAC.1
MKTSVLSANLASVRYHDLQITCISESISEEFARMLFPTCDSDDASVAIQPYSLAWPQLSLYLVRTKLE